MLTALQRDVLKCIAANRSETSYLAGGLVLNMDWPRQSDDVDIFHDTDEEIGETAKADIRLLRQSVFRVSIDIETYGLTEATVSRDQDATIIQWMSETKSRFFPLVLDAEWGARLHRSDLAVNKVLAASTRTKARDFVDLVTISERMCPLGPLVMAAAGKAPNFSPQRTIDEIRRRGLSVPSEQFDAVKGLTAMLDAAAIRERLIAALDSAQHYVANGPIEIVGLLAVGGDDTPVEIGSVTEPGVIVRRATAEPRAVPTLPETVIDWRKPD